MRATVLGQQTEKFERKKNQVAVADERFNDYKQAITNMIAADFAEDQDRIRAILREKAEAAKTTDGSFTRVPMYPSAQPAGYVARFGGSPVSPKRQMASIVGAVVPAGFEHYPRCTCYVPNPKQPWPTLELAELDMLSEQEARQQLKELC